MPITTLAATVSDKLEVLIYVLYVWGLWGLHGTSMFTPEKRQSKIVQNVNRVAFSIWTNNPCLWSHHSSESIRLVFPTSFPLFPSVPSSHPPAHHPLLITNNNHHVWSICCWTNIKWSDICQIRLARHHLQLRGWARSRECVEAVAADAFRQSSLHSSSSHSYSCTSALSGLLPASSLYPALYPPLSPPLCPTLALLNPLAVVHTHTHTALLCKSCGLNTVQRLERESKAIMR